MKRRSLLLLALLIAGTLAMLLLDFRLMQAQLSVDESSETYSFGVDEERPLPLEQALDLYVQAPPTMEGELVDALSGKLSSGPHVRNVNLRARPVAPADDSVLVVDLEEPSVLFWSPIYTRSVLTVDVAYASDGEVAWIDEDVVSLRSSDRSAPVTRWQLRLDLDGWAVGLISRPAYATYLADEISQHINQELGDHLAAPGG